MKENLYTSQGLHRPFWDLDSVPSGTVALRIGASDQVITYGELRDRRDHVRSQFTLGRGLCRIVAKPTVACIAGYLAALDAQMPIVFGEATGEGAPTDGELPCLYRLGEDGSIETDQSGAGLALHPELRLLLSTSGSTGSRKYVRLSSDNLASNAASIARYLKIRPEDRAPTSLPLAYSYGLSVLNSHLDVGASLVLIDAPVVSQSFWDQFDAHACTSFAGVPQSYKLLQRGEQLFRKRPSLRYLTQAGGKLPPEDVKTWAEAGRRYGWDFFVMYGQTEASPRIAYLPPNLAAKNPSSIGVAIPGGELWVADAEGKRLRAGQEGELVYSGPNVMMGYATSPQDLARGSELDQLKTGDLGYVDKSGLFHITGRASRFLKVSGKRVSLDEVESWCARHGVDCIAAGGDDALALIHTGTDPDLGRQVAGWLSVPAVFVHEIGVNTLPLNQNGKPDYRAAQELFRAASARAADRTPQSVSAGDGYERIANIFRHQFPGRDITQDTSFDELSGTSNDFVEMEMSLERVGVAPFENWQVYSVSSLAEMAVGETQKTGWLTPDHAAARAFCCLLVVMLHMIGLKEGSGGLNLPDASVWHSVNDMLDPLRMPLFALLSGYAFHAMSVARRTPREHFANISVRLWAPTIFAIICFAIVSDLIGTEFMVRTAEDVLRLFYLPYGHFWFVMALTIMMTVTYAIVRYLPNRSVDAVLIVIAAVLAPLQIVVHPNVWALSQVFELLPFFLCGYYYARHAQYLHARMKIVVSIALAVAFACWIIQLPVGPARNLEGFVLSLSYIALCIALAGRIPLLSLIAPYTFFIYLWHVFGTSGARRMLTMAGIDSIPVLVLVGTAVGVAFPILLFHLLARAPGRVYLRGK